VVRIKGRRRDKGGGGGGRSKSTGWEDQPPRFKVLSKTKKTKTDIKGSF